MWRLALLAACGSTAPPLAGQAERAPPQYCIERELPCEHGEQIVNGQRVMVLAGTDCVGPRRVECWLPSHVDLGEAHDVVGIGNGDYRYLRGDSLVSVKAGHQTSVHGGASRTYGPFGPYGLTAESRDGHIAIGPEESGDRIAGLVARDTVTDKETGRLTLPVALDHDHGAKVFASFDGARFGLCVNGEHGRLLWLDAHRQLELPKGSCQRADAELAHLLVRSGIDELTDVDLATGARARIPGRQGAFFDTRWVVIDRDEHVQLIPGSTLAVVPFHPDELRVGPRFAIAFVEHVGTTPSRAYLVWLPAGPGIELQIPPDTVDIAPVR